MQEQLMALHQTTIEQEYCRQFKELSAPLQELPSLVLEAAFVNAVQPEIQAELRQYEPIGLTKMRTTQKIKESSMPWELSFYFIDRQRVKRISFTKRIYKKYTQEPVRVGKKSLQKIACFDLCLQLIEISMVADFFPLKLSASAVVLGFQC